MSLPCAIAAFDAPVVPPVEPPSQGDAPVIDKRSVSTRLLAVIEETVNKLHGDSCIAVHGEKRDIAKVQASSKKKELRHDTEAELDAIKAHLDLLIQKNLELHQYAMARLPLDKKMQEAAGRVQHLILFLNDTMPKLGVELLFERRSPKKDAGKGNNFSQALRFLSRIYNETRRDGIKLRVEGTDCRPIPSLIDCEFLNLSGEVLSLMELKVDTGEVSLALDRWHGQVSRASNMFPALPVTTLVLNTFAEGNFNIKQAFITKFSNNEGKICNQVKPQAC